MKAAAVLLLLGLCQFLQAAEQPPSAPGDVSPDLCLFDGKRYSPGAIIKEGDVMYRCIAAFDDELQRFFTWVKVPTTGQAGNEITVYLQ